MLRIASFALLCAAQALHAAPVYQQDSQPLQGRFTDFSGKELCEVAKATSEYLNRGAQYDPHANHAGRIGVAGIDLPRVKATLSFICETVREDQRRQQPSRLKDPAFINRHFKMIRWQPDREQVAHFAPGKPLLQKMPDDKILLTKYYVKQAAGSPVATDAKPHALYQLPFDEQHLSLEAADAIRDKITRYRYTKHQVLTGILDKKHLASPLVWLSRADLEDTLLQGTVKIDGPEGPAFYNVHRNNGHAYDRNLKKEQQKRYWYFKQMPGVMGYGKDADAKIRIHPKVTVAGDLQQLGLGKLVLLSHGGEHRLTILADTGGAFENNNYQLDLLAGYYNGWRDYHNDWKRSPDYVEARILLLKQ